MLEGILLDLERGRVWPRALDLARVDDLSELFQTLNDALNWIPILTD